MLQASPIKFSLELALANFESLKSRKDNHTFSLSLFFQAWLVTASKVMRGLLQRPQLQRGTSRTSTRTLRRRSTCTTGLGRAGTRATRGTSWTFGDQLNPISFNPLVLVLGSVTARDPLQWCHFLREFFSCLSSQLLVLILPFLTTRWFLPWPSANWSSWTCSGCGNSHHIRQAS